MIEPTIMIRGKMPELVTYIGECCREWVLAVGGTGRCGLCGERPKYKRPDEGA